MTPVWTAATVAGPAIYLAAGGIYKKVVYRCFPRSHLTGLGALAVLAMAVQVTDLLMTSGLTSMVLLAVAYWKLRIQKPLVRLEAAHETWTSP